MRKRGIIKGSLVKKTKQTNEFGKVNLGIRSKTKNKSEIVNMSMNKNKAGWYTTQMKFNVPKTRLDEMRDMIG